MTSGKASDGAPDSEGAANSKVGWSATGRRKEDVDDDDARGGNGL